MYEDETKVSAESVEWTAEAVHTRLGNAKEDLRKNILQVDRDMQRDKKQIIVDLLMLCGSLLFIPLLKVFSVSMFRGFDTVVGGLLGIIWLALILWFLYRLLNSTATYVYRSLERKKALTLDGIELLTYEMERQKYEERILEVNKIIKEAEQIARKAENRGVLSEAEYERLSMLRHYTPHAIKVFETKLTLWKLLRACIFG